MTRPPVPPLGQFIPKFRRDYAEATAYSERLRHWELARTADHQLERLKDIWADCLREIPYYQRLRREGRVPDSIRSWDDFYSIPILEKRDLQERPEEFRRATAPDLPRSTAGSTGTPVRFGIWHSEDRIIRILKLVMWIRLGYQLNSRLYLIWGHTYLFGDGWMRHVRQFNRGIKDFILGYRRFDAHVLSPEHCERIVREMIAFRPFGFISYASALDLFLRYTRPLWPELRKLKLAFVMPAAESAPRDDTFALAKEAFGAPVVQEFGGVDFGQPAMQETDEKPFEVFLEHYLLEAHPSNSPEVPDGHDAVVTCLYPRYAPLIRYRQGDIIRNPKKLAHGAVHAFDSIAGRINEMVVLDSGRRFYSGALFLCARQEPCVMNIQMAMFDSGPTLRLVVGEGYGKEVEMRIRSRLKVIGPELEHIPFELVTDLETNRAGKRRWWVDKRTHKTYPE